MNKVIKALKFIGGIVCASAAALMMVWYVSALGNVDEAAVSAVSAGIVERYDVYANNANAAALDGIIPIKKVYKISQDQLVAPEPDQSLFGESSDPAVIQAVIDSAAELMGGQPTVWNQDVVYRPGTQLRYYCDETILVLTWKEVVNGAVYTFSEIKIADPSQIRRHIADNVFGSDIQYKPSEMATSVNAVLAVNGDFYRFRNLGVSVYNGVVYRYAGSNVDSCGIDANGDLVFMKRGEITEEEQAKQFVSENNILFSVAFGPILVDNGEMVAPNQYPIGEINDIYSRCGIGQLGELHYLVATCNLENAYLNAATIKQFATELQRRGCQKAYALDGGQSGTIVMNGDVINTVDFGYQRNQSDIIYFATAKND